MNKIFVPFLPPWVETGLQPAFYDKESGTVLQQTARMYNKVNCLIRNFNLLSKETKETVDEYVAKFTELKDFVDNYFDNLDVQDEINNKLDAMAEAGTLQEIITAYIQSNVAWTFDTVADMKLATNLVEGSYAQTLGFHTLNDGGGALYKITNTGTANEMDVIAVGSLYANLIDEDVINVKKYGAIEGNTDSLAIFNYCLSKARSDNKTLKALGEFTLSNRILLDSNDRETIIVGKLDFPNSDGFVIANQYKTILIRDGIEAHGKCIYVAGDPAISPRYIQRFKVAGYEGNKPILMSDTEACIELKSDDRGIGYGSFENLVCGSAKTSNSPALYMHSDTNSSFVNNIYFTDCTFNLCGNDRWMAELVGYTAWTTESNYFLNTSFESAETNAAGGLLLHSVTGCSFVNCRYMEHFTRSHKKYMRLEGRTYENVFDTYLSSRMEAFDLAITPDVPWGYNYFRNSRLVKQITGITGTTNLCDGFMIASDNTFRFGEPLQGRSNYTVNTGAANKTIGIEADDYNCCMYYPKLVLTNESAPLTITLTSSFVKQFASFDVYWSHYYRPTDSKTITIQNDQGQILDVLKSSPTTGGDIGHVHYTFNQQYGSVTNTYKHVETVSLVNPTTA